MIVDSEKKNLLFLMASPHPKGTTPAAGRCFFGASAPQRPVAGTHDFSV